MKFTPASINRFILFKIPIAWLAGIRVREITDKRCIITLKHKWLNQNPFHSVYFGVLVMAGELSTGIPLFREVQKSGRPVSMLVVRHESFFYKKATGRIRFEFTGMDLIKEKLHEALRTGQPVSFELTSLAYNADNIQIGKFIYQWSVKSKGKI